MNKQKNSSILKKLENDADIGYGIQKIRKIFLYKRESRETKGSTCVFIASKSEAESKEKMKYKISSHEGEKISNAEATKLYTIQVYKGGVKR